MTTAPDWRRNLAALWFAEFTAVFGFGFAFPFLPLFLRELGIRGPGELAAWTGAASGATGFGLALMSPVWGSVADRYGRRPMLIRAMLAGAVTVGLMGVVAAPWQLVVLRFVQGTSAGTIAAATALVATGTPRERVGWALGVLTSAIAVGGAAGPVAGGLLAGVIGLRAVFITGGVLLLIALVPVVAVVREAPRAPRTAETGGVLATLRTAGAGTVAAVAALLAAQALMQVSYSAFQPLVVLRVLGSASQSATSVTGLAFGLAGLASAASAVFYSGAARRVGYLPVIITAALAQAAAMAAVALGGLPVVVAGATFAGLCFGVLGPALSTMLGLETPSAVHARVFGYGASAIALGFGFGPLIGGATASAAGVPAGLLAAAALSVALAGLLALRAREPAR